MHVLSVINLFLNGRFSGSPEKGLDLMNFSYGEKKKEGEELLGIFEGDVGDRGCLHAVSSS